MKAFRKFKWGKPSRLNDRAMGIVVPIIREGKGKRDYVTLEESKNKVDIKDSGSISEVTVKSRADKPVFMRGGTLLKGQGTQPRVVTCGTVVMPEKEETIKRGRVAVPVPVACVQSSHPIVTGSRFLVSDSHAPMLFMGALRGGKTSQSRVWAGVSSFAASARAGGVTETSDNLISTMEQVDRFKGDINKIIDQVPATEDQIGMVVLDDKGVVGIELFDHPGSWKALVKSIVKSYAEVLGREDKNNIFEVKLERIIPAVKRFWEKLKSCKDGEILFESGGAKTVSFKGDGIAGEYTVLNGEHIHAIATRVEKQEEQRQQPTLFPGLIPTTEPWIGGRQSYYLDTPRTRSDYRPLTGNAVISCLSSEPKTFGELVKKAPMSKPTLSRRLKNGVEDQLVAKSTEGYLLTAKGLYLQKRKK